MKKQFMVVFEKGTTSYGAFAPDIPGCFAVGHTLEETKSRFLEAAAAHLNWLAGERDPLPEPVATFFDFSPEPGEECSSYYAEWLAISMPMEERQAIPA